MPPPVQPCRIAFLIRDLGPGGAQRQMTALAKALAARSDFDITVVHFYPGVFEAELRAANIRTVCVGKKSRWDLAGFFFRLVKIMRDLRPEVIHGYLHESNLMALMLKPFCGWPGIVWGIRDSSTDAATWGLLGKMSFRLNCLFSGFADRIIANSHAGRKWYVGQGYPEHSFEVIPNAIEAERWGHHSPTLHGDTFTVVGRLHPMKDHGTFLRALALVPEASGRIIGSGDESYARELRQLAETLGITSRLTWEPVRADLPQVYPTLDCVVSSSGYGEGFSNVIGEAMACGLPCIASDVGDSAWLISDARWIFEAGYPEALAARMRSFIALPAEERRELGNKNRARIQEHFTLESMVTKTAKTLKEVATGGSATTRVLWIIPGLGTGGAEMMMAQIIQGLPHQHHTVLSLTAGGKHIEPLRAAGARVHTLDMPAGKLSLTGLWRFLKLVRQARPTVIMGWMYHGCLAAMLARLVVWAPVVWNIRQSLYDLTLEKRGTAWVIRSLVPLSRLVSRITYNSKISAQQHEKLGYAASKTLLIANGFDLEKWHPIPPEDQPSIAESQVKIGRFGRYSAIKDYPGFLEAAALIVKEIPQARFILVGTDVDERNAELTTQIRTLGLGNHVKLLGERNDLPQLTAELDLSVSSSLSEGFPNVVGEAMACAVPVVATDVGDTAWVMGETGLRVPPRSPTALADACLKILCLPTHERRAQGQAGREHILRHFSLGSVLTQFETLLNHPVSSPSRETHAAVLVSHP